MAAVPAARRRSCAVSGRRSPCTPWARRTVSVFRIPRWSRARLEDTSALRKAPSSPSPTGGPLACVPGANEALLESKGGETVERVEIAAHRRRPGLAFPRLAWPLAQAVQVELPAISALRARPWHPRQGREGEGQLHRPPAIDVAGVVQRPIHVHRVPRVRRPGQIHALPRAAGETGVEERVGRRNLDLVVARPVARGIEEDLDHVRGVQLLVVLEELAGDVGIDGEERHVQVVVVPEKTRLRGRARRLAVEAAHEGTGLLGAIPISFREHAINLYGPACP